ncbi:MAG: ABC transporter ATP-binding protein/permease [Defluviitaleaceae bacterium]|nr:ABC transporter ATP-binding protein/permease [Defluviitaleaceae bacterium]
MKRFTINNIKIHFWDFIILPMRISPGCMLIKTTNRIITALIPAMQVYVTARFIDTAISYFTGTADISEIILPMGLILLIMIYTHMQTALMSFVDGIFTLNLTKALREALIDKRARLSYRHIEDNDSWNLISRVCKEPERDIIGGINNAYTLIAIAVRIISVLTVILTQIWWLALLVLAMTIPLAFLSKKSGEKQHIADVQAAKHERRADYLSQILSDRETVEERSLFGYSDAVNTKWSEQFLHAHTARMKAASRFTAQRAGAGSVTLLVSSILVGFMLIPLSRQEMTPGMFIGLATAVVALVEVMGTFMVYAISNISRQYGKLKDIESLGALSQQEGALDAPSDRGAVKLERIEFKNVSFTYPGNEKKILNDFSLVMEGGKQYAFAGVNGAGKTTITKLLTGLYDNYEGDIFINGRNLRKYELREIKAMFSVVYQDFARYSISLAENIKLGDVNQDDDERMKWAANLIGIDNSVEQLPKGYETNLGKIRPGGVDMSGGQWQRIAIARTLYGDAPMQILDEPTAALDPVAESEVYKLFSEISKGRSTLFITHRLGAARMADEIVVIDSGRVAEMGSHAQLMSKNGIYAEMFENQRSWYAKPSESEGVLI